MPSLLGKKTRLYHEQATRTDYYVTLSPTCELASTWKTDDTQCRTLQPIHRLCRQADQPHRSDAHVDRQAHWRDGQADSLHSRRRAHGERRKYADPDDLHRAVCAGVPGGRGQGEKEAGAGRRMNLVSL